MTLTRDDLRQILQKNDFTYREARAIVKCIFDTLTSELKKGTILELPFGTMVLSIPIPRRDYKLGRLVRTYTKAKVHFRRKD